MTDHPTTETRPCDHAMDCMCDEPDHASCCGITRRSFIEAQAAALPAQEPLDEIEDIIDNMPVAVLARDGGPAVAYAMRVEAYLRQRLSSRSREAGALPAQDPQVVRRLGRAIHRVFRHGVHGPGADDGDGDLAYAILDEYARLRDEEEADPTTA